ncbi:hypothetical protein [Bacteroides sp. 51]|uniref:hypothetical protein n=1 Tax=Bacteroides sp. 51 TaxID=2302938 RepID=UPI0013D1FCF1|nr:hypothetical protein [Bacteroides sp. 51]NDV80596.1 hypothetical protein [Bacteroides sp. 51]
MDTNPSLNKASIAFTCIVFGLVITSFSDKSISIQIAKFIAWIFILIGQIKLIHVLSGNGRIGAILLLVASVVQIIMRANGLLMFSIDDFFSDYAGDLASTMNTLQAISPTLIEGMTPVNPLDTLLETTSQVTPGPLWFELFYYGLLIAAMVLWLSYEPFIKAKSGIVILLMSHTFLFILSLPSVVGINIPGITLLYGLVTLISITAYIGIVKNTASSPQPTYGVILLFTGFLYTLLMLIDNSFRTSLFIIAGAVVFFIGNGRLRDSSADRKGTGGFVCYGILMIFAGLLMMIPLVGGILATILQVCSYLVVGIAFLRFAGNEVFEPSKANGMLLVGYLILGNIILAFIPIATGISAFLVCLIEIPIFLVAFIQGVNAVQME